MRSHCYLIFQIPFQLLIGTVQILKYFFRKPASLSLAYDNRKRGLILVQTLVFLVILCLLKNDACVRQTKAYSDLYLLRYKDVAYYLDIQQAQKSYIARGVI